MHASESIELQMSLLLFVALGGYLLASWIRQPSVVGQILLGVVIGPSVLGWVEYTGFVSQVAHLGAIILLFAVGLEFRLSELARWQYMVIGFFGVAVPWVAGFLVAWLFGFEGTRALIVGVALTATSIAITADTLRELGKLRVPAARAIIGAAVVDDVLALLALSIAMDVDAGEAGLGDVLSSALLGLGFLAIGGYVGQSVMTRLVYRIDESGLARRYPETAFVFATMMAFLFAIVAKVVGLSAIVGAFIAGVALEGVQLKHSRDFREGAEFLRIAFGAIFFVSLGVLVDLHVFTGELMVFTLVLTIAAVLSKLVGCGLPAWLTGMGRREALIVGVGMAPRGEVAMVVGLLALQQGVIEQPAYGALVMMSLLTTMLVPLLLRNWLYRGEIAAAEPAPHPDD